MNAHFRNGFGPFNFDARKNAGLKLPSPPYNLTIRKGSKNVALERDFAKFLLESKVARDFYNWISDMYVAGRNCYAPQSKI